MSVTTFLKIKAYERTHTLSHKKSDTHAFAHNPMRLAQFFLFVLSLLGL